MNNNLQTLAVVGAGTFASLWILENFFHVSIAHQAGKGGGAKGGGGATKTKGGGKAAAGGGGGAAAADTSGAAPAAAAGGNTWAQNPASKTPCGQIGQSCPTVGAKDATTWCVCQGGAAAPAAAAPTCTCTSCTAGATAGQFTCTGCTGCDGGAAATTTTPATSAGNVAYAYAGWAIAR